jgi:hypothetical protein
VRIRDHSARPGDCRCPGARRACERPPRGANFRWLALDPGRYVIDMGLANPYQCFKLSPEFHFTLSEPQPVYLGEFRPEAESISVFNYMDRDVAYFRSHATGDREVVFTLPPMQVEMIDTGCKNRMLKARAAYADTAWKLGRSLSRLTRTFTRWSGSGVKRVWTIRCPRKRSISCTPTSTLALPNCREMFSTCHPKSYARYKSSSAWTGVAGTPP